MTEPSLLTTDNTANLRVADGESSASRTRHLLRQYIIIQQRCADGEIAVRYVESDENPSDFLTKWVSATRFAAAEEYATNARNAVAATSPELRRWGREVMEWQLAKISREQLQPHSWA